MQDRTINDLKRELIREMGHKGLEPENEMVFDGQTHEYMAYANGEHVPARYVAMQYPLEAKREGPILICNYGLVNSPEQYTYSSLTFKK